MKNVAMKVNKNTLTLTIDLAKSFGPSKSGKSNVIATTEGNIELENHQDMRLGINVFKVIPKEDRPKKKKTTTKSGKKRVTIKAGK